MRIMALIVVLSFTCVGSESLSGIWSLNRHKSTKGTSRPIAIQIEQNADHFDILRIVGGNQGKYVEKITVNAAEIHSTHSNTHMTIAGSMETWTLRRSGELIIKRKTGRHRNEHFVLDHAREAVPFVDYEQEGAAK
jgi:hypothetical protein